MSRLRCIISLACLLLGPAISSAQVATGTPPFSSTAGGPDIINLGNLNIHIDAAILSKAGRGMPLTYALSYDSSVWYVTGNAWTPVPNWGWRQVTEALAGYVSYNSTLQYTWCNGVKDWITIYNNWAYHDPNGAVHPFPGVTFSSCTGQSGLASSTDGSGYTMSATGWDGVAAATVYTPAGKVIVPPVGSPSGPGTVTDSNGNQFNANVSGSTTSIYDTLSSATPALTITGSPLPTQLAYPSPAGSNATVTLTYTAYPIKTNFACSATQYTSSGNVNLLTDIQLPDGRYYHFQYEDTMGFPGYKTGRITSVQLPTGGTITYAYTGGDGVHNPIVCSDGSTPGIDRVTPDSSTPWHYSRSLISGSMWQTTVTTPNGDVTQMNFQFSTPNYYETKRVVNTGASSVVQTVQTCYNGAAPDCTGTAITLPITRRDVYLQLPSSSGTTAMTRTNYAAGGQVLAVYDYDFGSAGSGSPGALLRKNVTAYITLPSNSLGTNITAPNQVSILDGSGATQAQTTFTYDQGTPTATSGTPQHIAVTGSRENLTTMISGVIGVSNTLTRTFTYYDTGVVNTSTDVNGAATAYAFSSAAASCGNAFPTNVSMPLSLTRSMTWNCAGAVQTGATDENNQPTSVAYNDPAFWRPTASTDASSNSTGYSYSVTSATSSLSFNAGNSVVEQLTNLDSLARVSTLQKKQSPSSTYYDSVQTLYDALGRAYKTSIPYQGTAGQGGSAFTTTTFDGAGRTLTTTDVGGGSLTYSYNYNDVLVTVGPAPAGENTKRRQFEYDGLGRLKSVCEITSAGGSGSCGQANPQTGFSTVYTYDVMNHILSVSQNAQGIAQTRSFGYDQLGRMTYEGNPENGGTNYYYDHASGAAPCANSIGDLVEKTVAVGNVTCYAYDALHRVTAISYPSGTYAGVTSEKHFVYDSATVNGVTMSNAKGRLAEAYTGPNASKITDLGFSYTARGELADLYEKTPNSGGYYHPNQTYWANGAPNQLSGLATLPTITYGLDGEGRISTVSASSGQNPVTSTTVCVRGTHLAPEKQA